MNKLTEQVIALSGIFASSSAVHEIATANKLLPNTSACLIKSLTVINPATTLDVFGGDIADIKVGIKNLVLSMSNNRSDVSLNNSLKAISYYSFSLIKLEKMLNKRADLLSKISNRLPYIEGQCEHFGALHENVMSSCADVFLQTVSTLPNRIRIIGTYEYLKNANNTNAIRALLLAGIRCAMLWRQLGGNRWHFLFKRKLLLQELNNLLA